MKVIICAKPQTELVEFQLWQKCQVRFFLYNNVHWIQQPISNPNFHFLLDQLDVVQDKINLIGLTNPKNL